MTEVGWQLWISCSTNPCSEQRHLERADQDHVKFSVVPRKGRLQGEVYFIVGMKHFWKCGKVIFAWVSTEIEAVAGVVHVYAYLVWRKAWKVGQNGWSCFQQFTRPAERHCIWHVSITCNVPMVSFYIEELNIPSECVLRDRRRACKRKLPCQTSDSGLAVAIKCWDVSEARSKVGYFRGRNRGNPKVLQVTCLHWNRESTQMI